MAELSAEQESEVQELLDYSLSKGKLLSGSGRDPDVYKEYGTRYGKALRGESYGGGAISRTYKGGRKETTLITKEGAISSSEQAKIGAYKKTSGKVYQGPIQSGTSEAIFRETGKSVPLYRGPVQAGISERVFRETGRSVPAGTGVTIFKQQTSTAKTSTGKEVPVYELFVEDESGITRKASKEEIAYYEKQTYNPRTGEPYGTISAAEQKKGIAGVRQRITGYVSYAKTQQERGKTGFMSELSILPGLTLFGVEEKKKELTRGISSFVLENIRKTKESEDYYNIQKEALLNQSIGELLSQGNIPFAVIKSSRVVAGEYLKLTEKIRLKTLKLGTQMSPVQMKLAENIISEQILFSGFAPFMKTSMQLAKEIYPTRNDVIFTGVSQRQKGDVVKTYLEFKTTKGQTGYYAGLTKSQKVSSITSIKNLNIEGVELSILKKRNIESISKVISTGAGEVSNKKGIIFPTGEIITDFKSFKGSEIGLVKQSGKKFMEVSVGGTKVKGGEVLKFKSINWGVIKGKFTNIFGYSIGEKEFGTFTGMIKSIPYKNEISFVPDSAVSSFGKSNILSKIAYSSSASIVKGGLSSVTTKTISPIISVPITKLALSKEIRTFPKERISIAKTQEKTLTISKQQSITIQKTSFKSSPLSLSSVSNLYKQGIKQPLKSLQLNKQISSQGSKLALKSIQLEKQQQRQRSRLSLKSLQLSKQVNRLKNINIPRVPPKTTNEKFIFPFIKLKFKSGGVGKNTFSVYIRRFGKFKPIGTGLSLSKAFSLGTGKTRRTLAATFLVKNQAGTYRGKTPKGFYAKPSKFGTLYIQQRKFRLSAPSEKFEIQSFKKRKRRKKR